MLWLTGAGIYLRWWWLILVWWGVFVLLFCRLLLYLTLLFGHILLMVSLLRNKLLISWGWLMLLFLGLLWFRRFIPPSYSFILWRIMHGKMPTDENLHRRGCVIVSICNLCLKTDESSDHLFLRCSFAKDLWLWLGGTLNIIFNLASFQTLLDSIPPNCSSQVRDVFLAVVVHTIHHILLS